MIAQSRAYAADLVLASVQQLSSADDGGWSSLTPLLALVRDEPLILAELEAVAMLPAATRPGGHASPPPEDLVKRSVLSVLARAARSSEEGLATLRRLAASPDPGVRKKAVRTYLETRGDRRAARRELRRFMSQDDWHLLYRY